MGNLKIISRSSNPFTDRIEAGELLGQELLDLRGSDAVVLGIPRGGVIVAREIAKAIYAEVDILLSRKLRAPGNPELAIGAVGENGGIYLSGGAEYMRVTKDYIQAERDYQMAEIERRAQLFRAVRPRVQLEGRVVVVTDDGVATGSTMLAALWSAREEKPARLIAALPVAPEETLRTISQSADETICLRAPALFMAVGQFYERFEQIEDDELVALLEEKSQNKRIQK